MNTTGKVFVLYALLACSICAKTDIKKVLKAGTSSKIITKKTNCRSTKLDKENTCICCILKHSPSEAVTEEKETKILNASCLKHCSGPTLNSIAREVNFEKKTKGTSPYIGLVPLIIKKYSGLQSVDMSDATLDQDGNLKGASPELLLARAAKENDDLEKRIKGKTFISEPLGKGGAQTLQLFLIKENNMKDPDALFVPKYILKGIKKAQEEVKNLEIIRNTPSLQEFILDPDHPKEGMPALAMDVANFTYMDNEGKEHDMSLLDYAGGEQIGEIIMAWVNDPKNEEKRQLVNDALGSMGKGLAILHKIGFVHRDPHFYNVIYDQENKRAIFIDNETGALSIPKSGSPSGDSSLDLEKVMGRLDASNWDPDYAYLKTIKKKMPKNYLDYFYANTLKPFIKNYFGVHKSPLERQYEFRKICKIATTQGAVKTFVKNPHALVNPIELKATLNPRKNVCKSIARDDPNQELKYP